MIPLKLANSKANGKIEEKELKYVILKSDWALAKLRGVQ